MPQLVLSWDTYFGTDEYMASCNNRIVITMLTWNFINVLREMYCLSKNLCIINMPRKHSHGVCLFLDFRACWTMPSAEPICGSPVMCTLVSCVLCCWAQLPRWRIDNCIKVKLSNERKSKLCSCDLHMFSCIFFIRFKNCPLPSDRLSCSATG